MNIIFPFQDENVSQAITQGGGCLTLHSKWKSAFDDSEASDNETEMKGENLASPEHAKQAGAGGDAEQVAATTRALELSRITENTSCKEEGAGKALEVPSPLVWLPWRRPRTSPLFLGRDNTLGMALPKAQQIERSTL